MINIALYGSNDKLLDDISQKLSANLHFTGHDYFRIHRVTYFQTTLFEDMYDLFIIDITEKVERGLTFAQDLKKDPKIEIIFVASRPSFAMDAYDLDALAYFLVPIDFHRLNNAIFKRFSPSFENDDKNGKGTFPIKTVEGLSLIPAARITYLEYADHRIRAVLDTGDTVVSSTMRVSFMECAKEILADPRFVRTHASFIVNIEHIRELGKRNIILDTKASIPISHAKHSEVKKQILQFFKPPTA